MVPLHQSVIWLAPCHHISQSFDLPTATTSSVRASASASTRDRASASTRHRALPYHRIIHLTCPLPPQQSVIWLAHCHHISQSFDLPSTTTLPHWSVIWLAPTTSVNHLTCPHHHISQSFDLPTATTSVSHLTCPLPPYHQSELVLEIELVLAPDVECYHITASVSHLTCPLPPHQSVIWLAHCHHIISQS